MSKGICNTPTRPPVTMANQGQAVAVNITSDLGELVSIPIRQELHGNYSGIGGERVQSWFSSSEQIGRSAGWTKELMRRYLPGRFTGPAAAYQEKIDKEGRLTDYEERKTSANSLETQMKRLNSGVNYLT